MDEGQRRLDRGVRQIQVEAAHLGRDEHTLVDDRAGAHRADVEDLARKRGLGRGALLDGAAAQVEAALEGVARGHVFGAAEEGLLDGGHAVARGLAEVARIAGDVAPEEQRHAALGADALKDLLGHTDALVVLGQKEHGHAVVALARQQGAEALGLLTEEAVGDLEEDARAIAGVALQAAAAAVLEVDEDGQGIVHDGVAADALEVGDGADAAGVVVELLAIQALVSRGSVVLQSHR